MQKQYVNNTFTSWFNDSSPFAAIPWNHSFAICCYQVIILLLYNIIPSSLQYFFILLKFVDICFTFVSHLSIELCTVEEIMVNSVTVRFPGLVDTNCSELSQIITPLSPCLTSGITCSCWHPLFGIHPDMTLCIIAKHQFRSKAKMLHIRGFNSSDWLVGSFRLVSCSSPTISTLLWAIRVFLSTVDCLSIQLFLTHESKCRWTWNCLWRVLDVLHFLWALQSNLGVNLLGHSLLATVLNVSTCE